MNNQQEGLYTALSKLQGEMQFAKAESSNPFFKSKYADLATIIKTARPHLAKHGLCVIQTLSTNGDKMYLHTRLGHSSGQSIESVVPITPVKNDIQSIGSYITYMRRYSYSCIVGIATGEGDDDGETVMVEERKKPTVQLIAPEHAHEIIKNLIDCSDDHKQTIKNYIKQSYNADDVYSVPEAAYMKILNTVLKMKEAANG